jgi:hypothetical protein
MHRLRTRRRMSPCPMTYRKQEDTREQATADLWHLPALAAALRHPVGPPLPRAPPVYKSSAEHDIHQSIVFQADATIYCRLNTETITRCKWLTSLICFFSVLAGLFRLRPPNTHIEARVSFGSLLRCTRSLYPLLLAKPPGTGVHEAGIQYCMVESSQQVCALVWTNPCRGMEIELPAILGPDNLDNMDES